MTEGTEPHDRHFRCRRSIALAWGLGDRPARGPRPGLTLDTAGLRPAYKVAMTEGLGALSMGRSGQGGSASAPCRSTVTWRPRTTCSR